jgi:hypothetical protein
MAGSPGDIGSPGRVTVPTPAPALKRIPAPAGKRLSRATTSAPCVTSGSSPASLMTLASAQPSPCDVRAKANAGVWPRGRRIVTGSGKIPVSRACHAALAAAVAQAPVVQPRRSGRSGRRAGGSVSPCDCGMPLL